jgi:hypothetical protein
MKRASFWRSWPRSISLLRVDLVVGVAAALLVAVDALARPGGGGSFSGGGGGGGGGGYGGGSYGGGGSSGGGGGGLMLWLFFNLLPWPLKLVVVAGIIAYVLLKMAPDRRGTDWSTTGGAVPDYTPPPRYDRGSGESPRATLARLRENDPAFSIILFEDFLYTLYAEAQQRRARGELKMLSAYLSQAVIARLESAPREPILGLVIGAMRYESARITGDGPLGMATVSVELEVNLTVQGAKGPASAYLVEVWQLARRAGAQSRPPASATILDCPNCGAPLSAVIAGRCTHCNQQVATGDFGWVVQQAEIRHYEAKPPLLTSEVQEEGNNLPTVIDRNAAPGLDALWRRDPSFAWPQFEQRVGLIFREFQVAWSNRDLKQMRPFLSDNLFQQQTYWVQAYLAQHLRNVTENARIERLDLARVDADAAFDAITVRVFASSLDYTLTDDGKLVTGSRSRERRYTEYWTLIRGSSKKGPTRTEPVCPSCGAPLEINMAGTCKYCQAKVTSGEFDWVLSRIEQDEVYTG